jgi:hypothetical protein
MGTYTGQSPESDPRTDAARYVTRLFSGECPRLFNTPGPLPTNFCGLCRVSLGCRICMLCQLRDAVYGTAAVPYLVQMP